MSYRPFKNFEEFKKVTGCDIGKPISICFNDGTFTDTKTCLIVSFNDNVGFISLGTKTFSYKNILDHYLFFSEGIGKFEPLGIEIEDEPKPKKVRPAKFQVGHFYAAVGGDDKIDQKCQIQAKFCNAGTKHLQVVADNEVYDVYTDLNGNEYIIQNGSRVVHYYANLEAIPF